MSLNKGATFLPQMPEIQNITNISEDQESCVYQARSTLGGSSIQGFTQGNGVNCYSVAVSEPPGDHRTVNPSDTESLLSFI